MVQGPLALKMRRLAAADEGCIGLQLTTLPLLAARLAGGFLRPAQLQDLESSLQAALNTGGFADIEPLRVLPGMTRAAVRTLKRVWDADVDLDASLGPRFSDLALLEQRVREGLPADAHLPRDLRRHALLRVLHAPRVVGELELDRLLDVPQVWRPLIHALSELIPVRWIEPGTTDLRWFPGEIVTTQQADGARARVVTCANPRSEVMECLRWARQLLATGRACAHEIAICAASTDEWDDHLVTLAKGESFPIHFSNGLPALSTRDGQACASLADLLVNGLSQDRVRRLFDHAVGRGQLLRSVRRDWAVGISPEAGLFQLEHWERAFADSANRSRLDENERTAIESALKLLARGLAAAEQAGEELLGSSASSIWHRALTSAPADALSLSLQFLRLTDDSEAGASIVWCPATHLVGAPRPYVWLLGLTSGTWPQRPREDPLLPDHLLPRKTLDPDPIGDRQRRAFEIIRLRASQDCTISRSRRGSEGGLLPASPLLAGYPKATALKRGRIPQHAFSETDRLLARPQDAREKPRIRSALSCWSDWNLAEITPHDGRVRDHHSLIKQTLLRTQSATSLARLLRDPLGFIWRYALGWRAPAMVEEPLSLDARAWGELVHEILRRTVDYLEPDPGYTRASREVLQETLRRAVSDVRENWPLERPVPPLLLWQHTLRHAEQFAHKALTRDESFNPGTRCWTEVPFGSSENVSGNWPWSTAVRVGIQGTDVSIRGSIDRLDINASGTSVRVTDYKTGREPPQPDRMIISGGAELQRVIYAIAATELLPQARRVVARLFFLREDVPRAYELPGVAQAIDDVSKYVAQACALLNEGKCLPGLKRVEHDDYRIALPASEKNYLNLKGGPIRRQFGVFTRIWDAP